MKAFFVYKNKFILKSALLACLIISSWIILAVLLTSPKTSALVGDPSGTIPNNGTSDPWMIVTRPGTNGMDSPRSNVSVYVPTSLGLSFPITIQDACDGTVNDGGGSNDTVFAFPASITNVVIHPATPGSVAFQFLGAWMIRCDSGSDAIATVTLDSGIPIVTIGSTQYRVFILTAATTNTGSAYYANRFKFTTGGGVLFGFNSALPAPGDTVLTNSEQYTGIAYDNVGSGWSWSTRLSFALPCNATARTNQRVYFYDTDHNPFNENTNPEWQTPNHPMTYTITRYNRDDSNPVVIHNPNNLTLTGGQNVHESTLPFTIDSRYKYSIEVTGINYVNSIQIALPINPIYAVDSCPSNPPSGSISASCVVNSGTSTGTVTVSYSIVDADGDNLSLALSNGVTASSNTGSTTIRTGSFSTFSAPRQTAAQSVTGTVTDVNPGSTVSLGSATFTCPLPAPPVLTITSTSCTSIGYSFTNPSGEGFSYTVVLTGPGHSVTRSNQSAGSSSFSEVADWRDFRSNSFTISVTNNTFTGLSDAKTTSVGPCVRMTCGGMSVPTNVLEVNRQFNLSPTFITKKNYGNAVEREDNLQIGLRGTAESYNIVITMSPNSFGSPALPSGTLNNATANPLSPTVGAYTSPANATNVTISYGIRSGSNPSAINTDCTAASARISQIPYFQSFLGDVIAGYGMKDASGSCSPEDSDISAFVGRSLTNASEIVGAGAQTAVFARGAVIGFRSAITETGRNQEPWFRTFANTSPVRTSTQYGGEFNSSLCIEDWFDDRPTNAINYNPSTHLDISNVSGAVRYTPTSNSPIRMYASATVTGSRKIFVDGSVIIGNDSAAIVNSTTWSNMYDIPSTTIVATGDIYIDDNLTQLDAVLVSQGTVFTCTPTNSTLPNSTSKIDAVNSASFNIGPVATSACYTTPLTLNGGIVANSVRLWRTGGTVSRAFRSGSVQNSAGNQGFENGLTQAETFRLSPETFLSPRLGERPSNGVPGQKQFDSLISLPPTF